MSIYVFLFNRKVGENQIKWTQNILHQNGKVRVKNKKKHSDWEWKGKKCVIEFSLNGIEFVLIICCVCMCVCVWAELVYESVSVFVLYVCVSLSNTNKFSSYLLCEEGGVEIM